MLYQDNAPKVGHAPDAQFQDIPAEMQVVPLEWYFPNLVITKDEDREPEKQMNEAASKVNFKEKLLEWLFNTNNQYILHGTGHEHEHKYYPTR